AMAPDHGRQHARERDLLAFGQILLAHAHPAAARRQGRGHHLDHGPTRLMAVSDQHERRFGKLHGRLFDSHSRSHQRAIWDSNRQEPMWIPTTNDVHVPTRPNCGLDGSAWVILGIRPARRDQRPASTAARMLFAIITGSLAFDTAVLSSTAEQPSSMASAASEAVPMPASSTTGTGERAQTSSMRCGLQMPSPEPIGAPGGITAAAPTSASLRQTTGSSVQ